ncbi:unnamed protein product, partial [Prorocentrum cordatum]
MSGAADGGEEKAAPEGGAAGGEEKAAAPGGGEEKAGGKDDGQERPPQDPAGTPPAAGGGQGQDSLSTRDELVREPVSSAIVAVGGLKEDVEKFIAQNEAVDVNAAGDLRSCPPEVQRIVLSRGDLSSARNPSAALIARIRDARTSVTSVMGPGGPQAQAAVDQGVEAFLQA